jgi:hypothetical protein
MCRSKRKLAVRPPDRPEPELTLPASVADVLADHVTMELECIDRMYLNLYQPRLMYPGGVVGFFKGHRGQPFPSSALMDPISKNFVAGIHRFIDDRGLDLVHFRPRERKDDVAQSYLAGHDGSERVLFVGRAQEKNTVFRTEKRTNPLTGSTYPWIVTGTAMVNNFYFYAFDDDFGAFFLKFGTYFPYTAKLCINGHHWAQRQALKAGIDFKALDNGFASCDDPAALQRICDGLSPARINRFARKWLGLLPHPFTPADRRAGYRYDLSVLQAEFSLTQVLDRPVAGRVFFEEVIRDNLDIGRPDQVALTFARRINRRTPGRFRTRVITEGVTASLHVDYKHTKIKQYHKLNTALRTETTINDSRDFGIGRRLVNLPALGEVGFSANRRLLDVQRASAHPVLGEDAFAQLNDPVIIDSQRAPALRFGVPRTHALLQAFLLFVLQPHGFANRDLRQHLSGLLGISPDTLTPGKMSYELRRARLHGIIERYPHTNRYHLTSFGLRAALHYTLLYNRLLRPTMGDIVGPSPPTPSPFRRDLDRLEATVETLIQRAHLAA